MITKANLFPPVDPPPPPPPGQAPDSSNEVSYLYSDHLGSLVAEKAADGTVSYQKYTSWGAVRSGGLPDTTRNFTGQLRDTSGLLNYQAREYDPVLGRFLSPDSVVPGAAIGVGGALGTLGIDSRQALRPLAVDFHEGGFLAGISQENAFTQQHGFWFELSNSDRGKAKIPWGPANPQALNRYSYALDNPLRYWIDRPQFTQPRRCSESREIFRGLADALSKRAGFGEAVAEFVELLKDAAPEFDNPLGELAKQIIVMGADLEPMGTALVRTSRRRASMGWPTKSTARMKPKVSASCIWR